MAETILHIDIETFNELDLKRCGMYKYAEHESSEVLCMAYRFGRHGPLTLWVPRESLPQEIVDKFYELCNDGTEGRIAGGRLLVQPHLPHEVREHVERGGRVGAHNAGFERTVLNGVAGRKIDFPRLTIKQMKCTAAKSRASGLPGALGDVAKALGTHPKMAGGHGVMLQVCRPKKATKKDPAIRWTPENAPDKYVCLYIYCCDDVYAEVDIDYNVPDLVESEQRIWELDQRINDKGVYADIKAIEDIQFLIDRYKEELYQRCMDLTWDFTTDTGVEPTQRARVADWVRANGWPYLSDMQAETVKGLLENDKVPKNVKKVLAIYSIYNAKATSKFEAMRDAVCADGRIRGMFIYHGAGPGRWSSVLVQFQNMARGAIEDPDVAIEACAMRDLTWIKELYPHLDPMKVFASCVRGVLIAAPGKKLVSFDFAGIESRVGAWLAGEEWKVQAFRDFDAGVGPDVYCSGYSKTFRTRLDKEMKDYKKKRQLGKVIELFGIYEGGVGAFQTFAKTYGVKLEEIVEACWSIIPDDIREKATRFADKGGTRGLDRKTFIALDSVKRMWRGEHPATSQLWRDLKEAAYYAITTPGSVYSVPNKKIMYCVRDRWLYAKLPSGRKIAYFEPEVDEEGVVSYMGIDTDSRRWMRVSTYGGKQLENVDQGFSSCLLRKAMRDIDEVWHDTLIMSVHDEAVMEVDEDLDILQEVIRLACAPRNYTKGLPLAAEGWEARRYKK
ncbi:MAG: hypothetical protein LLG14_27360 [Nocardiaceae bacterium]|nr:hypothetical protein [Nocardiaceae bacterium]